jgi:hypothetical protein
VTKSWEEIMGNPVKQVPAKEFPDAMDEYQRNWREGNAGGFPGMNHFLRTGETLSHTSGRGVIDPKLTQKYIDEINSTIRAQKPLPANTEIFRGIEDLREMGLDAKTIAKGQTFTEKGFFSATRNRQVANEFAQAKGPGAAFATGNQPAVFRMVNTKGDNVLDLKKFAGKNPDVVRRGEMVYPSGTTFKVTSVAERKGIKVITIEAQAPKTGGSRLTAIARKLDEAPPGTQASMDGAVAGDLTYEGWLLDKPVAFQKQILGPSKWKLWKDGKINFRDLVDESARPLTIEQLEAKAVARGTVSKVRTTKPTGSAGGSGGTPPPPKPGPKPTPPTPKPEPKPPAPEARDITKPPRPFDPPGSGVAPKDVKLGFNINDYPVSRPASVEQLTDEQLEWIARWNRAAKANKGRPIPEWLDDEEWARMDLIADHIDKGIPLSKLPARGAFRKNPIQLKFDPKSKNLPTDETGRLRPLADDELSQVASWAQAGKKIETPLPMEELLRVEAYVKSRGGFNAPRGKWFYYAPNKNTAIGRSEIAYQKFLDKGQKVLEKHAPKRLLDKMKEIDEYIARGSTPELGTLGTHQFAMGDVKELFKKLDDPKRLKPSMKKAMDRVKFHAWDPHLGSKTTLPSYDDLESQISHVREHGYRFHRLTGPKLTAKNNLPSTGYNDSTLRDIYIVPHERAYNSGSSITLDSMESAGTILHEMGHGSEKLTSQGPKMSMHFIRRRVGNRVKPEKLSKLTGQQAYDASEKAFSAGGGNDFIHPYVGKVYSRGGVSSTVKATGIDATEVVSMGIEQFTSAEQLWYFMHKDYEHFKYIMGYIAP